MARVLQADHIQDQGYLIRSVNYQDSHRILSFLTLKNGRIDLIAYGAKKKKSWRGILDFLHLLHLDFSTKGRGSLRQLSDCQLVDAHLDLKKKYQRLEVGLHWIQILAKVIPDGEETQKIFSMLRVHLCQLCSEPEEALAVHFYFRLLSLLGYQLELSFCKRCKAVKASAFYFLPEIGGILCCDCHQAGTELSLSTGFPQIFGNHFSLPSQVLTEAWRVLDCTFQNYLKISLKKPMLDLTKNIGNNI